MSTTATAPATPLSQLAENLIGSEIIKIGGQLNARIAAGEKIANLTIGDFDPKVFPLPEAYVNEIITAYREGHTNYPQANGMEVLRAEVAKYIRRMQGLAYDKNEVLIASGGRPLIYAAFRAIVDPQDKVVFPIPSWNNNHYAFLTTARPVAVPRPHVADAALLAVCSPLNPTGTSFSADQLAAICDLVLEENSRRAGRKPLYLLYDQIYSALTLGETVHVDPVSLRPEMRPYTIFIDGVSKAFAATGVRVGWAFGPERVMQRMHALLGHIGAWAPKPEQIATARLLKQDAVVDGIINGHLDKINERVSALYDGFMTLKAEGFPVDAIPAEGAMYLTVKIDLQGRPLKDGTVLGDAEDVAMFLIRTANVGMVPFYAFGADRNDPWCRISVGTLRMDEVPMIFENLRKALALVA
jgi:aspartate aminotransferase